LSDLYRDPDASIAERVTDLLGRMTLEEKVRQLGAVWVTALVDDGEWDADRAFQRLRGGIGRPQAPWLGRTGQCDPADARRAHAARHSVCDPRGGRRRLPGA
jgi:beta-glucosidase